jgi:spore coat polysaccharide biosynthesis predicted glycosyltransferase SpsG
VPTELQLVRGRLTAGESARAGAAGALVVAADAASGAGVVVVDLPEPNDADTASARLVVFDDRNRFAGRAAIVVQPSQPTWTGPGEGNLVLAGPEVAPIADAYRRLRSSGLGGERGGKTGPVRVVVGFGGSDPARVGERLAPILAPAQGWRAELILGAGYEGPTDDWPVDLVRDPRDLPERLAAADLLVLAAGMMKYEAACLGRAAILVAAADDQLTVGPSFAATGAAIYLGDGRTIAPERVRDAIDALAGDPDRRAAIGARAAEVVDGRGAERLAEAIMGLR